MYARVTIAQPQGETLDDFVEAVRTNVIPAAQAQAGYKGFLLLLDRDNNRSVGVTLWESPDALAGSETGYYQEQMAKLATYLSGQLDRVTGEVVIQDGF